ncbi:Transcription factor LBX1 [Dissostichus eleginoides]|uniref:Transcription factor LBX1 n=1 Tax=Dissostichus eleginoides TaxID=100907 RepID=A0AAD9F651_DISEL|nr:Transcription factor LBX1 [Dissostichus eleginoides]
MMTSKEVAKCDAVENRRRSPLDHLPPPANSNKPLTPFSIEDILNKPSVKRSYTICGTAHLISSSEKHRPSTSLCPAGLCSTRPPPSARWRSWPARPSKGWKSAFYRLQKVNLDP